MKNYVLATFLILTACPDTESSDYKQKIEQEKLNQEAHRQVGMPAIVNFQEKRVFKMILELRDTKISTVTYTQDMNGVLHKLCNSIGFPIPYATQYTNPQQVTYGSGIGGVAILPQADPNGLFSPASAEGTWVLCMDPKTKDVAPVYVEPRVVTSPFELK